MIYGYDEKEDKVMIKDGETQIVMSSEFLMTIAWHVLSIKDESNMDEPSIKRTARGKQPDVPIDICCNDMCNTVMMNVFRDSIVMIDGKPYIMWGDGDCVPMNYCPSCGKKVEVKG